MSGRMIAMIPLLVSSISNKDTSQSSRSQLVLLIFMKMYKCYITEDMWSKLETIGKIIALERD